MPPEQSVAAQMPVNPVQETVQALTQPKYAGFWVRFCAMFIDGVILGLVIQLPLEMLDASDNMKTLIPALATLIYYVLLESSSWQGTLGKRALHIKVTDLEGNRLGKGRALGRHLAKIISGLIFLIGYIMVAFTKKKQGLHDILAKTLVVRQ